MGHIEINIQLCKGCGYCVKYCTQNILEIGTEINNTGYLYSVQTEPEKCTGCGICAMMCPDAAINVYKED